MWNFQKHQQGPKELLPLYCLKKHKYEAKSVHKTFTGGPITKFWNVRADSCGELSSSASVGGKSATPVVAGDAAAGPGPETMVSSKLGQIS